MDRRFQGLAAFILLAIVFFSALSALGAGG